MKIYQLVGCYKLNQLKRNYFTEMQQTFDTCNYYFNELSNKVTAESGIWTDGEHLGKIIIRCLKEAPNFIAQVQNHANDFTKIRGFS